MDVKFLSNALNASVEITIFFDSVNVQNYINRVSLGAREIKVLKNPFLKPQPSLADWIAFQPGGHIY